MTITIPWGFEFDKPNKNNRQYSWDLIDSRLKDAIVWVSIQLMVMGGTHDTNVSKLVGKVVSYTRSEITFDVSMELNWKIVSPIFDAKQLVAVPAGTATVNMIDGVNIIGDDYVLERIYLLTKAMLV